MMKAIQPNTVRRQAGKAGPLSFSEKLAVTLGDLIRGKWGSIAAGARKLRLSESSLRKYTRKPEASEKPSEPTVEVFAKICRGLGASADELLDVEGEFVRVKLYATTVSAGHGAAVETEEAVKDIHYRRDWLVKNNISDPKQAGAFEAKGSSMAPMIEAGDIVLFNCKETSGEGVFVVRIHDALSVKQLEPQPDGARLMWGKDDRGQDKLYGTIKPEDLKNGSAQIVGRVFWRGGKV